MKGQMKQAVMTAPETIEYSKTEIPEIGPQEVLIQIKRIGICGSDIHVFYGKHPYTSFPVIQGHETSGIVVETGSLVTKLKKGDSVVPEPQVACGKCDPCKRGMYNICDDLKVIGFQQNGTAVDYFAYPENRLVLLPEDMDFDEGAMMEPVAVAVGAVKKAGNISGKQVLVIGAGPIGNLVAQTAKAFGASKVMQSDINPYRLDIAGKCGIDYSVNSAEKDLQEVIAEKFGKSQKADVIFECSGVAPGLRDAVRCAKKGTDIIVVAVYGSSPAVDMALVNENELRLIGTARYIIDDFRTAIELVHSRKVLLKDLITDHFDFYQYEEAYRKIEKHPGTTMKVMITVNK